MSALFWLLPAITALVAGCAPALESVGPSDLASEADAGVEASGPAKPKVRKFLFTYGSTITGLEPGATARVWLPLATSSHDQQVTLQQADLPAGHRVTREQRFGNPLVVCPRRVY